MNVMHVILPDKAGKSPPDHDSGRSDRLFPKQKLYLKFYDPDAADVVEAAVVDAADSEPIVETVDSPFFLR